MINSLALLESKRYTVDKKIVKNIFLNKIVHKKQTFILMYGIFYHFEESVTGDPTNLRLISQHLNTASQLIIQKLDKSKSD